MTDYGDSALTDYGDSALNTRPTNPTFIGFAVNSLRRISQGRERMPPAKSFSNGPPNQRPQHANGAERLDSRRSPQARELISQENWQMGRDSNSRYGSLNIPRTCRSNWQYAGRLHRLHASKREVTVYDYVAAEEPVLARMAAKRRAGYHSLGYR